MALNIKNEEVEQLVCEVTRMTGETKTEAVRRALLERMERLTLRREQRGREDVRAALRREIWSSIPAELRGRGLAYKSVDNLLGFGPEGV